MTSQKAISIMKSPNKKDALLPFVEFSLERRSKEELKSSLKSIQNRFLNYLLKKSFEIIIKPYLLFV